MWIRVNDVPFGEIPIEQEDWLQAKVGNSDQFVSIEEGDWSLVRSVGMVTHPLSYVLENHPGEYIVCDKESYEATLLRRLGLEESKGYYSDQAVFLNDQGE
jgi:hypothetical protein